VEIFRQEKPGHLNLRNFIAMAGKTQEHLTRCMKRYYAETPTDFINRLRIQHAAVLLREKKLKTYEIIYALGFHSQPYFNKCFRKYYGLSPSAYVRLK
jgi:AraC family cel operon transcriptional repressor